LLDELQDRLIRYLSRHNWAVLCSIGPDGPSSFLVHYRNSNLELECLLPRWADASYHLWQDPRIHLVVPDPSSEGRRWLEYTGVAHIVEQPDWGKWSQELGDLSDPADLYLLVRVTPIRIDLIDETRGWGRRETLEFSA